MVGLDAAEATLIERWSREGHLPTFASLASQGTTFRLASALEEVPVGIWAELTSGRSCARTGLYCYTRQVRSGQAELRGVEIEEVDPTTYWTLASDAGRRVAAVDMSMTVPAPALNGPQVLEWGTHDRIFGSRSDPPELLHDLRERYGDHPVHNATRTCDDHGSTRSGYESLARRLLDGVERRTELLLGLLAAENWDLFSCSFTETHCAGHQFWHLLEERGSTTAPGLGDALRSVYEAVDAGLARLIETAGSDATTLVIASHGMGPATAGAQLLPEVLVGLGFGSGKGRLARARSRLPLPVRAAFRRLTPSPVRAPLQEAAGSLHQPLTSARTRAVAVDNDRIGAIRLNLRGREPFGSVSPGPEADALVEELRAELTRLEHPDNGERIVASVATADEVFGDGRHPNLPDLFVRFRTDLGPLPACRSPRTGLVQVPIDRPHGLPRTGEHTPVSRLWARGPGIDHDPTADGHILDVAPTVLSLLGVPIPPALEGKPLLG